MNKKQSIINNNKKSVSNEHIILKQEKFIDIPNIQNILIKEYELCFNRASSIYELTNNILKFYSTIFFAILSVLSFAYDDSNKLLNSIFSDPSIFIVCLLFSLVIFGIVNLFMHISTWAARNFYRKQRSMMQRLLFGLSSGKTQKEEIIDYLSLPRYVNSGVLHSLSLYLWYLIFYIICNWIGVIILSSILFGFMSKFFIIISCVFLPSEWLLAELYVVIKKVGHKAKSKKRKKELIKNKFDFYQVFKEVSNKW